MSTLLQVTSDLGYYNHDRFTKEVGAVSSKPARCSSSYIPRNIPKITIERAKSAQYHDQNQATDNEQEKKFRMPQAGQLVYEVNKLFHDARARLQSSDTEKDEWENIEFDDFDDSDEELLKETSVGWGRTYDSEEQYQRLCDDLCVAPCRSFKRQMKSPVVNISHCGLKSQDVKPISILLVNNTMVADLTITDNDFGDTGMMYLADVIRENVFITSLDVSGNKFGSKGFKYLVQGLLCNKTITRLCVARNNLDKNSAKDLKVLLERNDCVVDLDLSGNKIDEDTGSIIAPSIASNVSLKRLNLSWNHIRRKGATAIAKAVCSNVELEELNLSWNGLAEEGSRAFGSHIHRNHTLLDLNISNNRIGFGHLGLFLKGMKENDTLQTLKIDSNPYATDGAIAILKTFEASTKTALKTIDLQDVPVNNDFLELANTLRITRNLSVIHRDPNKKMVEHVFREIKVEEYDPVLLLFEYMRQENIRLIDLFRLLDKDHDNEITHQELKDGFKEMNIDLTDLQIRNFIEMLDKDDSKTINISEMKRGRRLATNKRMICAEEGRETMAGIIKHMQELVKKAREEKMKIRSEARMEQKNKANRELRVQSQSSRPVSASSSISSKSDTNSPKKKGTYSVKNSIMYKSKQKEKNNR